MNLNVATAVIISMEHLMDRLVIISRNNRIGTDLMMLAKYLKFKNFVSKVFSFSYEPHHPHFLFIFKVQNNFIWRELQREAVSSGSDILYSEYIKKYSQNL